MTLAYLSKLFIFTLFTVFFYEECHTSICVVTIDLKNKLLLVGQSGKKSAEKKSAGKKSNLSHLGFLGLPIFLSRVVFDFDQGYMYY